MARRTTVRFNPSFQRKVQAGVDRKGEQVIDQAAHIAERELKNAAPVDKGTLRNSIRVKHRTALSVVVGTVRIPYASITDAYGRHKGWANRATQRIRARLRARFKR